MDPFIEKIHSYGLCVMDYSSPPEPLENTPIYSNYQQPDSLFNYISYMHFVRIQNISLFKKHFPLIPELFSLPDIFFECLSIEFDQIDEKITLKIDMSGRNDPGVIPEHIEQWHNEYEHLLTKYKLQNLFSETVAVFSLAVELQKFVYKQNELYQFKNIRDSLLEAFLETLNHKKDLSVR